MWETYFGFKKTPFGDSPDGKQLFVSAAWQQVNTRLEFLQQHPGCGLITGDDSHQRSTMFQSHPRLSSKNVRTLNSHH